MSTIHRIILAVITILIFTHSLAYLAFGYIGAVMLFGTLCMGAFIILILAAIKDESDFPVIKK